jgi:ADP-L-glycero-D-manno-heptose 6-epimerase
LIVVTGGAGFIGSCVVAALEAAGHAEIVVCDRLGRDDKWRNLAKRALADLIPPEALMGHLDRHRREIEAVIHMGAISATTEADADLIVESNFRLTMRLWDWCAAAGARLLYASSAATYGDGGAGFSDALDAAGLAALRPLNAYGWSKHLTDRRILHLAASGAPRPRQWAGLKFFNVYGPNEYHKGGQQSVVVQVHRQIKEHGVARLFRSCRPDYADGGQLRDFVWVDDVAAVILWLLDHPGVNGLYNVGSGRARSFLDLATSVFAALGLPPSIEYVEMPAQLQGRYQYFTLAPLDRLRAAGCEFQPTPLEEGVRRYVQDSLEADDPYR